MKKSERTGREGGREDGRMGVNVGLREREWSELEEEWEMEKGRGEEGEISEQRPTQQGS